MNTVIIQSIGLLALLANLSIFQTNKRKNMLLLGLTTCLLWAVHLYLLGALTGVAMNLIAAARFYVYYKVKLPKQKSWVMWVFMGLTVLATALTWQGWVSLLPFAGTASLVIAFWQEKPKYIRRLAIASSPPWIIYGLIVGSPPVVIAETLLMVSNFIGQYRFDFRLALRKKNLARQTNYK